LQFPFWNNLHGVVMTSGFGGIGGAAFKRLDADAACVDPATLFCSSFLIFSAENSLYLRGLLSI
jgi:hypothetical protein